MRALTWILSTRLLIRIIYGVSVPRGKSGFQAGFATLQLKNSLKKYAVDGGRFLDMGTGAIAVLSIWLKKNYRNAKVTSVDVDTGLVESAKNTAKLNNAKIDFAQSDLFKNIRGKYDLVFFNPPLCHDTYRLVSRFLKTAPKSRLIICSNGFYVSLSMLEQVITDNGYKIEDVVRGFLNPARAYVVRRL